MQNKWLRKPISATLICSMGLMTMFGACAPELVLAQENAEVDYTDGIPWLDSNIDGVVTPDLETDVKEDYYLAVNKDTILDLTYEPGEDSAMHLQEAYYDVRDRKLAIMQNEDPQTDYEKMIRSYYLALDDWDTRTELLQQRIPVHFEKIESLQSMKEYCEATYDMTEDNSLGGVVGLGLTIASDDASTYSSQLLYMRLTLGDAAEYEERTEYGQIICEMYKAIYTYGLEVLGEDTSHADEDFEAMLAFEAKLAEHSMTVAEQNCAEAVTLMDNYYSIEEIDEMLGENYEFAKMLEMNGLHPEHKIKVSEPEAVAFLGTVLDDDAYLDDIKNMERVQYVMSIAGEYSKESMLHVDEIARAYQGIEEETPYEYQLLESVNAKLGMIMQQVYVEKYADAQMKSQIQQICEDVAAEYCIMLQEADWLEEETREAAIRKLNSLKINAVYPDKWDDYSEFDVTDMNYYEAEYELQKFYVNENIRQLNQKIDPEIWEVDPTTTNAFYIASSNSINILLGILGEYTYTNEMSKEEMYGRIGMVIGHEISHAFDSSGSQYDEEGNLRCWWTESDKEKFDERVAKVRAYFDEISLYGGKKFNGSMLDGEASADITSIECLLRMAQKDPDFDYDLFFRSTADMWAMKATPFAIESLYMYDTHPAAYLRVNVVFQQFDEFLETYDITEGDRMYLDPADRIVIW